MLPFFGESSLDHPRGNSQAKRKVWDSFESFLTTLMPTIYPNNIDLNGMFSYMARCVVFNILNESSSECNPYICIKMIN